MNTLTFSVLLMLAKALNPNVDSIRRSKCIFDYRHALERRQPMEEFWRILPAGHTYKMPSRRNSKRKGTRFYISIDAMRLWRMWDGVYP